MYNYFQQQKQLEEEEKKKNNLKLVEKAKILKGLEISS